MKARRLRIAACAVAAGLASAAVPAFAFDDAALLARLEALRVEHGIAGVGLVIVADGKVAYAGGLGVADRASGRPVDADTLWRVGSVTKSFTGLATLLAAREDGFDLDAPVRSLVSDAPFENPWESTDPVRVGQLLEHTAGFMDLSKREFDSTDPAPLTLAQAFAVDPASRTVRWRPGRYSSYSNSGAGLAALVIERTTGQRYEDFVTTRILRPLGMHRAGFAPETANDPRRATGYDSDGVTPMPYWHTLYRAFGGLDATVGDMGAWVQWLIDPARAPIVPAGDVLRMERPATTLAARAGLAHGYGLGLYRYVHGGVVFTGHGGDADGYLSRLGYHRASRRGYFLVINAFRGEALRAMQDAVEDALSADLPRPAPPATPNVRAAMLASLAGCYVAVTQRFPGAESPEDPPLQVAVVDGGLVTISGNGRLRALIAVGGNTFRRDDDPVATSAFVEDDGRWMLQGEMGNLRRIELPPGGRCPPAP